MIKRFLLFLICAFVFQNINAQVIYKSTGARSAALGGCGLLLDDPYSPMNNQASMAFQKKSSVAFSTARKYWLSDLMYNSFAATFAMKNSALGLTGSYNGFTDYNQTIAGLSYARLLTEKVSIGVQLDYLQKKITEYGSNSAVTFEAGAMVKVMKKLNFAAHVFNPVRVKSGYYQDEKYPAIYSAGLQYKPSETFFIEADIENNYARNNFFKIGAEYRPVKSIALRVGVNNNEYSFGAGLWWKNFRLDIASSYHRYLGITPTGSIAYEFGAK